MDYSIASDCISRTACEPECSDIFGANRPQPACAQVRSKSDAFDGQIEGQAPALTEDDCYLVALALFLASGVWQIASSYLK